MTASVAWGWLTQTSLFAKAARAAGIPFQVNTVVRKGALATLDRIYEKTIAEGATRLDLFFLVPTGRGMLLDSQVPDEEEISVIVEWAKIRRTKLTCCPSAGTCIGGRGFAFLSHTGVLQTCGFVQTPCGSIRDHGLDFRRLVASASNPLASRPCVLFSKSIFSSPGYS